MEKLFLMIRSRWNRWVSLGVLAVAVGSCLAIFLLAWLVFPQSVDTGFEDRAIVTRLPAPTYTVTPQHTSTPVPLGLDLGEIFLGSEVEIFDTGGSGLRFRAEPGIGSDIQFIAPDGEDFRVEGGPVEEDGFVWWYLESLQASGRKGWAVSSYLRLSKGQ